ncbi:hypothetical protein [Pseudomonas farris]
MKTAFDPRIVAFVDILGFESLVQKLENDPALHEKLNYALRRIKHLKVSSLEGNTAQSDLEISVFSDSIAISAPKANYHGVIWTAIHLQSDLLTLGILTRGGISCGKTVHEDDILYGEGMINAYKLESRAAIYPRILVDCSVLELLNDGYRSIFLRKDTDGLWHLDPFSIGFLPSGSDALVEDGWDPHEVGLDELKRAIDKSRSDLTNLGQVAKWNWLDEKRQCAVEEYRILGKPRFWVAFDQKHSQDKDAQQGAAADAASPRH